MYERIMVPLDGSDAAEAALPYAEEVAAKLGAELVLASVADCSRVSHVFRSYLQRVAEQIQCRLKDSGAGEGDKVSTEILIGKAADEILNYADESKVNLIVMSSRGLSGQGPWPVGSVAAKVIRTTAKTVLLVRSPASAEAVQQRKLVQCILVPLDGSQLGESAISCTEALAATLGAEVVVLHALKPSVAWEWSEVMSTSAYIENMLNRFKSKGIKASSSIGIGNPSDHIIHYATANAVDLIAMSSRRRSRIGRWFLGSTTTKVLQKGATAVLMVRAVNR